MFSSRSTFSCGDISYASSLYVVTELPNLSSWKKKRKTTFSPLLSSDNVHTGRRPGSRDLCASNRIRIGTVLFCFNLLNPLLSSENVHTGRRPGSRDLCASNRIRIGTVLFCFIKFHVVQLCSLFVVILLLFCCAVIISVYHTLYDTE